MSGAEKKRVRAKTYSITIPDDPLAKSPRLIRTEGRVVGEKLVYKVKNGLLEGFDCWLPLCRCVGGCARAEADDAAGTAVAVEAAVAPAALVAAEAAEPSGGVVSYCRDLLAKGRAQSLIRFPSG